MERWIKAAKEVAPALAEEIIRSDSVETAARIGDDRFATITKVAEKDNEKENIILKALRENKSEIVQIAIAAMKFNTAGKTTVKVVDRIGKTIVSVADEFGDTIATVANTLGDTVSQVTTETLKTVSGIVTSFMGGGQLAPASKTILANLDGIGTAVKSVKTLSYLNAGIGLTNLGIEAAGIAYIGKRLNEVQKDIENLSTQIGHIKSILTSEKISDYHKLCLRFSAISVRLKDGDLIDRNDIEALLIDMRAFISEMIRNFYYDDMDADTVLNMVFNLLAAYVGMLNVFVREYYFDKGRFPDNLEMYNSLFSELLDDHFLKLVGDYLMAKKGLSVSEMIKSIQTQQMLVMNAVLQHEDQKDILQIAGTREKYQTLMEISDRYAKEEIERLIPAVKKQTGIEDCGELIHGMLAMDSSPSGL